MLPEQLVISLGCSIFNPFGSCLVRVNSNVCFGVVEVGSKIDFIVGVTGDVETNLIGTRNLNLTILYALVTAFGFHSYAHGILHAVVVELCFPYKFVLTLLFNCSL